MNLLIPLALLIGIIGASHPSHSESMVVEDGAPFVGHFLPEATYTDDSGTSRTTVELLGVPTVFVPIYTRCKGTCPKLAASLKSALIGAGTDASAYRVVLFSFDPVDGPEALRAFREREKIPLAWTIASADREQTDALMKGIGFRYATAGAEFLHASVAVVLDPKRRISRFLFGSEISSRQLREALDKAEREEFGGPTTRQAIFGGSLFALTLSCGYLVYLLGLRRRGAATA